MTDRFSGFVVTLTHDMREDDAEYVINALKMVKYVLDVKPIETDHIQAMNIEIRVKHELREKLYGVIKDTL